MTYDSLTTASPSALARWSHRTRLRIAARLLDLRPGARVLDYGAGDGAFLELLSEEKAALFAFEPMMFEKKLETMEAEGRITLFRKPEALKGRRFDRIACLEVFEHLTDADAEAALFAMREALEPEGRLLVSVPIEIGPASLLKNIARAAIGAPQPSATMGNIVRAALGMTLEIPRPVEPAGYIDSHIGFDHRALIRRIADAGFRIESRSYSPLPCLGALINSQVFLRCETRS